MYIRWRVMGFSYARGASSFNATSFSRSRTPALIVGRSPWIAAHALVGLSWLSKGLILRAKSGSRGTRADQGIGVKISYAELRLVGEDCWPASGILMNCAGDRDSPRFVSIAKRPCLGRRRVAPTASYEIETRRYAD